MTPVDSDEEDLTRKQRREQARAERKAAEESAAADAARRRRLGQLGGAFAVVVVVIVAILIITSGGGTKTIKAETKEASKEVSVVDSTLSGTTEKANVLGNPNAPVTMQYFGDLECPICRDFTLGALPQIIQTWVKSGKLKIEYRSLETATREPETFRNQQAAMLAAGKQNLTWYFIELFYHEQGEEDSGYVTECYLQGLAKPGPRPEPDRMDRRPGQPGLANQIAADDQEANNEGFKGHTLVPDRQDRGSRAEVRIRSPDRPVGLLRSVRIALKS